MIELRSNDGWTGISYLIPAAAVAVLVDVVATKHAKASLMEQIAMTVLAAVGDRHRCPRKQKASLGTVGSVCWSYL